MLSWLTGVHLWRSEYGSFIREAQVRFCSHLIVVPLTTFHRLAEAIGDPKGELIFLFSTPRCGSTLLTEVIHWISLFTKTEIHQIRNIGDQTQSLLTSRTLYMIIVKKT